MPILVFVVISMEALKKGALLHVSQILSSKNLSVKIVGCGLISHLLDTIDYGWGADLAVLESIMTLLQQYDDCIAVVGASAMFTLVKRGETLSCDENPSYSLAVFRSDVMTGSINGEHVFSTHTASMQLLGLYVGAGSGDNCF